MRNRLARDLSRFAKVTWVVWCIVLVGVMFPSPDPWVAELNRALFGASLLGLAAMVASYALSIGWSRRGGVRLERDGLSVQLGATTTLLARDAVASAHAEGAVLHVSERSGDTWAVRIGDPDAARIADAIARELGFGLGGKAARYDFDSRWGRFAHVGVGLAAVSFGVVIAMLLIRSLPSSLGSAPEVIGVALVYAVGVLKLRRPAITLGADGLRIEQRGNVETLPLEAIRAVDAERLALADGRTIRFVGDPARRAAFAAHAGALLARTTPEPLVRFARGDLPIGEWRARVRGLVERADYRVAASQGGDELAARMGAPRAKLEDRVAAALALRVADPEGAAARIRVAAEQCVMPEARAALEAAASAVNDEGDVRLERALRKR